MAFTDGGGAEEFDGFLGGLFGGGQGAILATDALAKGGHAVLHVFHAPDVLLHAQAGHPGGEVLHHAAFGEAVGDLFFTMIGEVAQMHASIGIAAVHAEFQQLVLLGGIEAALDDELPHAAVVGDEMGGEAQHAGVQGMVQMGDAANLGFGLGAAIFVKHLRVGHGKGAGETPRLAHFAGDAAGQ